MQYLLRVVVEIISINTYTYMVCQIDSENWMGAKTATMKLVRSKLLLLLFLK
jgi:hypothetical protein